MIRSVEVFQHIHKHHFSTQQQYQQSSLQDDNDNDYSSGEDDDDDDDHDAVPPCDADVALTLLKKAMNYYDDVKAAIAASRSYAWSVSSSESVGCSSV